MNKRQRFITGVGLAAGLIAGGGAGLILEATGSAGASTPSAATDPPTTTATNGSTTGSTATPPAPANRIDKLKALLQPLVDDGTLTQAQLDAVVTKLETAGPLIGRHMGGRGFGGIVGNELNTVASVLGVTAADVRTAIESGQTLAAYAQSKGKTAQDVIDAVVADAKKALDAKVTAGTITQAQADTQLTKVTTRITDVVDNGFPARGPGGRHGGRGMHGEPDTDDAPAGTAPATTTPATTPATTG